MRWDWPKQTLLSERGEVGDCWRCCVAAILQIPAMEVPHFADDGDESGAACDPNTQDWLNARGHWLILASQTFYVPRWAGSRQPIPPIIACGPTVRSVKPTDLHAIVMVGETMVYDPHPSEAGLLAIVDRYLIVPAHSRLTPGTTSSK